METSGQLWSPLMRLLRRGNSSYERYTYQYIISLNGALKFVWLFLGMMQLETAVRW